MNYLTLALRLKYSKQDFDSALIRLNVMYCVFASLNVIVPILEAALYKSVKVSGYLDISVNCLWLFTVGVLLVALSILRSVLHDKNNVEVNYRALTLHCIAFLLFAIDCSFVVIQEF
jgi:hypothetical protein